MDSDSTSRRRSERARQTRDQEVEAIPQAAGMPGLRVLTGGMDDSRELAGTMMPDLWRMGRGGRSGIGAE